MMSLHHRTALRAKVGTYGLHRPSLIASGNAEVTPRQGTGPAGAWNSRCEIRSRRAGQSRSQQGFSLLELITVICIISAMAAVAMPRRQPGIFALRTAQSTFVADMRAARARAIARGVHYGVEITDAQSYEVLEMMEAGGDWTQAGDPEVSRMLPPSVSFSGGIGDGYEFNTRGLLVEPITATTLTLVDSTTGNVRTVDIWPSGQVVPGEGL